MRKHSESLHDSLRLVAEGRVAFKRGISRGWTWATPEKESGPLGDIDFLDRAGFIQVAGCGQPACTCRVVPASLSSRGKTRLRKWNKEDAEAA